MTKVDVATIKFATEYSKMPFYVADMIARKPTTTLLAVLKVDRSQLSKEFIEWDTMFRWKPGNFELSHGKEFLVLLLLTGGYLWTTIRPAWPPQKEEWYRSHVGEDVNIQIEGVNV